MKSKIIVFIFWAMLMGCEKEAQIPPGEAEWCVECQDGTYTHFDTCGSLDALNQWEKKNKYIDCYYRQKP